MSKESIGFGLDLEGPLVNLEIGHHLAHLRTAEEAGIKLTLHDALEKLPHLIGGPDKAVAEDIYQLTKTISVENILKRKNELFNNWLKNINEIPIRKGLVDFLQKLIKENIPMVIGTATDKKSAVYYLNKSGLNEYFPEENVIYGGNFENNKPAPDIYLATAKLMGINPKRQIVIEDSPRGVKAAVAAGSLAIGLPVIYNKITIENLKEAGAKKIYKEWKDIKLETLIKLLPEI